MLSRGRPRGFTLIELMVTLTLVALLLALGVPSLSTYLQNSKVANAAQNFYSGLQLARTEAIRRNLPVEFVLTGASGINGQDWLVRAPAPAASGGYELIDAKAGQEGNGSPGSAAVTVTASASAVIFNGFGQTTEQYVVKLEPPDPHKCATVNGGGPIRCRQVLVSPGGRIQTCDTAINPADASDSRHC